MDKIIKKVMGGVVLVTGIGILTTGFSKMKKVLYHPSIAGTYILEYGEGNRGKLVVKKDNTWKYFSREDRFRGEYELRFKNGNYEDTYIFSYVDSLNCKHSMKVYQKNRNTLNVFGGEEEFFRNLNSDLNQNVLFLKKS